MYLFYPMRFTSFTQVPAELCGLLQNKHLFSACVVAVLYLVLLPSASSITTCVRSGDNKIFAEVRKRFGALSWIHATGVFQTMRFAAFQCCFQTARVHDFNMFKKRTPYHLSSSAKGASSKELVELLEHTLPLLLQEFQNPITVYFWGGTCDITKKQGKYIDIRGKSGDIIPVLRSAKRAPANIRRLNHITDAIFYCSVCERSQALALLNARHLS